jgi:hypothetical protein
LASVIIAANLRTTEKLEHLNTELGATKVELQFAEQDAKQDLEHPPGEGRTAALQKSLDRLTLACVHDKGRLTKEEVAAIADPIGNYLVSPSIANEAVLH